MKPGYVYKESVMAARVTPKFLAAFKAACKLEGVLMSDVLRGAARDFVDKNKKGCANGRKTCTCEKSD